jgi:hypothetical protein
LIITTPGFNRRWLVKSQLTIPSAYGRKKEEASSKVNFTAALHALKKPKAQEALKAYHVAFMTALKGIAPGADKSLKDKVTEAWTRFEIEH